MNAVDTAAKLTSWLATQIPDATNVRVEGLDRVEFGHSAETLLLTVVWHRGGAEDREDVVVRVRPPAPGLLEPYNLKRQFDILSALEGTAVRAPRARWFEGTGEVLGREFYIMERLPGSVYERELPEEFLSAPDRAHKMVLSLIEQIAAIHNVDLEATGLDRIADGRGYLDREIAHWENEIHRVQRGPLPAIERLIEELKSKQPEQTARVTLVHGDTKAGNFAFVDDQVSAVFDWEMATIGDPLADIGWAELLWLTPGSITGAPGAPTADEFVAIYEKLTGLEVRNREWYRAFQGLKVAAILLVGAMLFDASHSDDPRLAEMAFAVHILTQMALADLGVTDDLPSGPVMPRDERLATIGMA